MANSGSSDRRSEDELRAIYDQGYVDQYDAHAVQRMRRMVPFFELAGHEVVADFGCGNGVLLELIGSRVGEYVGVDFSEAFVHAAERRRDAHGIRNGTFHCDDLVAFCARHPNHFDAGFALDFSEHIYDDQFVRIFRAIHGALKPGASLYLHTPNGEYFMERLREWGVLRQIEGHVAVRDVKQPSGAPRAVWLRGCPRPLPRPLSVSGIRAPRSRRAAPGRSVFRARLFLTCRREG